MGAGAASAASAACTCPPSCSSTAMRFSIGGWVSNICANAKLEGGFSMNIWRTSLDTCGTSGLREIFISAEISASGFLVRSTDPASAWYSRRREIAKRRMSAST